MTSIIGTIAFSAIAFTGCRDKRDVVTPPAAIATTLPAATNPTTTTAPTTQLTLAQQRRIRRPMLTDAEYTSLAESLRKAYNLPAAEWPKATVDQGVVFQEIGKLEPVKYPDQNPFTKEKEALGRQLFWDPRLSGSGQIACASCHDPDLAWADGRTVSFGHGRSALRRNAPSLQFAPYATSLFWDGRSGSLEDQAEIPIRAHDEMGGSPEQIAERLNTIPGYRKEFKSVFGVDEVKIEHVAQAIATFERSLAKLAGRSAFDKFLGGQSDALSDTAVRGLDVFRTAGRCLNCHSGPTFSDNGFHNLGFTYYKRKFEDLGRYLATDDPKDVGKFRTPTLRNVGRTRPYLHNGLLDMDGLLAAYNAGMPVVRRPAELENDEMFPIKDPLLQVLHLNKQDLIDLKAFLESLNEPPLRFRPPPLPNETGDAPATAPVESTPEN